LRRYTQKPRCRASRKLRAIRVAKEVVPVNPRNVLKCMCCSSESSFLWILYMWIRRYTSRGVRGPCSTVAAGIHIGRTRLENVRYPGGTWSTMNLSIIVSAMRSKAILCLKKRLVNISKLNYLLLLHYVFHSLFLPGAAVSSSSILSKWKKHPKYCPIFVVSR